MLYQMPSTAIAWSVYEGFKHVINNYSSTAATQHPYDTLASEIRDRGGAASGGGLSSAPGHAAGVGGSPNFPFFDQLSLGTVFRYKGVVSRAGLFRSVLFGNSDLHVPVSGVCIQYRTKKTVSQIHFVKNIFI